MRHKQMILNYLKFVESVPDDIERISEYISESIIQTEYPNQLNKKGQVSDYSDTLRRLKAAKGIIYDQKYNVRNYMETEDQAVVESLWEGKIVADMGPFKKDQLLTANFCMFFTIENGKIVAQRNYDCFQEF